MPFEHETLVAFAKSFGLFYLIALSVAAGVYALWPSKRASTRLRRAFLRMRIGHVGR